MIDLQSLMYREANFASSEIEGKEGLQTIKSEGGFYYRWWKNGRGIDVATFSSRSDQGTLRLFAYPISDIYKGVDLDSDTPSATGLEAVKSIRSRWTRE